MGESDLLQVAQKGAFPGSIGTKLDRVRHWLGLELRNPAVEFKGSFDELQNLVTSMEEKTR